MATRPKITLTAGTITDLATAVTPALTSGQNYSYQVSGQGSYRTLVASAAPTDLGEGFLFAASPQLRYFDFDAGESFYIWALTNDLTVVVDEAL